VYASQLQTPTGASKFFPCAPSTSSVPQSRELESEVYDEDDYKSMWADISQHTVGMSVTVDDEQGTEYSGIFQLNP
jgi:hypothetical protein